MDPADEKKPTETGGQGISSGRRHVLPPMKDAFFDEELDPEGDGKRPLGGSHATLGLYGWALAAPVIAVAVVLLGCLIASRQCRADAAPLPGPGRMQDCVPVGGADHHVAGEAGQVGPNSLKHCGAAIPVVPSHAQPVAAQQSHKEAESAGGPRREIGKVFDHPLVNMVFWFICGLLGGWPFRRNYRRP